MKDETALLTTRTSFDCCPVYKEGLFDVREGINVEHALSKAACLAESIAAIASAGVQTEMETTIAYLVEFATEAIRGLTNSVLIAHERQGTDK